MSYGQAEYGRKTAGSLEPREVEAAAFVFVNRMLQEASTASERIKALHRNHKLWSLLVTDVGLTGNELPPILKKDLVSVGAWSMSYSIAAMSQDRPIQPLVDINNDMVDALRPRVVAPVPSASVGPVPGRVEVAI